MRGNELKRNLGSNRVLGNNERGEDRQIDPKVVNIANDMLQR
jgi:hypothetical protein